MALRVELFCEDGAHESSARALVVRAAGEAGLAVSIHTATASGGMGRLKRELRAFQATVARRAGAPDLLVLLADANAVGATARRGEIEKVLDPSVFPRVVLGTPDPCIERWMLADPESFGEALGVQPDLGATGRSVDWKARLVDALEATGAVVMQGGAEFAEEIFAAMDLYRAGRADPTLKAFTDGLRGELRAMRRGTGD